MTVAILAAGILLTAISGCATTTTSSTTWTEPAGAWVRPGTVESVREVVQRVQGNPAGGALAGALIGGFLFGGRGPGALLGVAGGAAVGAAASQGVSESHSYQILVRFDDNGTYGMFVYARYAPFRPGERVVLTPQGLAHG